MKKQYFLSSLIILLLSFCRITEAIAQPTLASGSGASSQAVCSGVAIVNIVIVASEDNDNVSFSPPNTDLVDTWNATGDTLTISGIPQFTVSYEVLNDDDEGISGTITLNTPSTAPASISGTTTINSGESTTLTAVGGTSGTGATFQWYAGNCGTGSVLGTGSTLNVSPTSTTTYFVRRTGTCNTTTCASVTVTVNIPSTAPTSISGTTTICLGDNTTLTAVGGTSGTGATFQWYTGSCGGTLISGESGISIDVSPTTTTTYFVRRTGTSNTTSCASVIVTVNTPSTAPASISGTTTICSGDNITLTAVGGASGTGATFQWYAGGCGTGSVLGTNSTLNVSPTSTTTYFVRRTGACNTTSCASVTVTVNTLSTAPATINGVTAICQTESTLLTAVGGTDGTGASFQWYAGGCGTGSILGTSSTLNVTPSSTTTYFVRRTGTCNTTLCASVTVTVNTPSSAPTSISGNSVVCPNESTTLTAVGGTDGTGASYQWYVGGCGSGISLGSNSTLSVSPSSTTTYFVRRTGACGTTTCASISVNVNTLSTPPTSISGASTAICPGDCVTLVANGATLGTGASYQWYSGNCNAGSVLGTNPTLSVCPTETTTYSVRVQGDCNTTNCFSVPVVVNTASTVPTISGVAAICSGSSTALTAFGGVHGTDASYQWYQGSCGVGGIVSTNSTYQATAAGTYFVRRTGTCNTTVCASIEVIESITPNITTMTTTICSGAEFEVVPQNGANGIVPAGTVYAWSIPSVTGNMTLGNPGQNQDAIRNIHAHNTNTNQTATYTVNAIAPGNCVSSFTLTVTVVPGPGINSIPDYSFCNGLPIIISPFTSPTQGVSWAWSAQNPGLGIVSGTSNVIPNDTAIFFPDDPNSPATTNVVVTATAVCSSETTFSLTVYPTPEANTISEMTFCEGAVVPAISLNGTPSNVLFNYQSSGGGIGMLVNADEEVTSIPSFTAVSSTPPISAATIQVIPFANGCEGDPISFQINVIEEPENPAIIDDWVDNALCGNSYGQLISAETPFPASYSWTGSGNVSIIAGINNQNCVVNFLESGQATLTVVADYGGCSSSSTVTYSIGDSPNPSLCASIVSTPDGNGLVCLNNNVDSYQWGTIVTDANSVDWLQIDEDNSGNGNDQFYYGSLLQDTIGKKIWLKLCRDSCCTTTFYPDGCTDSPVLSILENQNWKSGVRAYPNPTVGIVYLSMPPNTSGNIKIIVTDISGKMLLQREEYAYPSEVKNVDMTDLNSGIYFIRVSNKEFGETTVKLLKH